MAAIFHTKVGKRPKKYSNVHTKSVTIPEFISKLHLDTWGKLF